MPSKYIDGDEVDSQDIGFIDPVAPAYLKTLSDITAGLPVSVYRFLPSDKIGAVIDGTDTDNRKANLREALACGAKEVVFPHGTMWFDETVNGTSDNMTFRMGRGAVLKGSPYLTTQLLRFYGRKKVTVSGGLYDTTAMPGPAGGVVRDAFTFDACEDCVVEQPTIKGVFDPAVHSTRILAADPDPFRDCHGDSGIFVTASRRIKILHPTFINMPDCAIYLNATPNISEDIQVVGGHFWNCYTGIAMKRAVAGTQLIGQIMRGCYYGITTEGASGVSVPGKQIQISLPNLKDCYYPMLLRWAENTQIDGAWIQNMLGGETTFAGAIWLQGCTNVTINNPHIFSDTQYPYTPFGVFMASRTEDAVSRATEHCDINGGLVANFRVGVREYGGGSEANYNKVMDLEVIGNESVSTAIDMRGAQSLYRRTDSVNKAQHQSGEFWLNEAGARLYFRSTDGSTFRSASIRFEDLEFWYRNTSRVARFDSKGAMLSICPTYADNAAALAGGLTAGNVYKTTTGELRIVV